MYIEKRYIKKIAAIFEDMDADIRLISCDGACIIPDEGDKGNMPLGTLAVGINHRINGLLCRALDLHPVMFLTVPESTAGAENMLKLADAMVMSILKSSLSISSHSDAYRRILKQELTGSDLISRASEHQIQLEMPRCVMLFCMEQADKVSTYSTLGELVPLNDTDVLIEMNRQTVALIKDMDSVDGISELEQFAQAVQETLMEEVVQTVSIGIGEEKHTLATLGESYAEAKLAMQVGRMFHPEQSIHAFQRLMLERFLMNVPREESTHYHAMLFNRKTSKLFNDEMLQTIEMFFRKDLNLSDTARQLFIHRNTLVYRLDKVQKQTGLDLRHFDDAVTFKILYELKKCGQDKPRQIY